MKPVNYWFWTMSDPWGRRRRSPCRASAEEALLLWGATATRIEGTAEIRNVPETDAELSRLAPDTGGFMRESRERMLREGDR